MPCQHSRPLDFMITEKEIRKAAEKLKNNKSPFSDKIRNEMMKASIDTLIPVCEKSFKSGCLRKPGKMLKMSSEGGQQNKLILTS